MARVGQHADRWLSHRWAAAADPPAGRRVLFLDRESFAASFAADLPADDAAFIADSQVPRVVLALNGTITEPAWRSKPSWYLVAPDTE